MSDHSQSWSYREGSKVVGPLDAKALRQLHEAGVISDATEVARTGSDEWTRFPEVAFTENVVPASPQLPSVPKPLLRRDESPVRSLTDDAPPIRSQRPDVPHDETPIPRPSVVPETPTPESPAQRDGHGVAPTVKLEDAGHVEAIPLPPVPPASPVPRVPTATGASISFPCKSCGEPVKADAGMIGLQVACPGCGKMATIPAAGAGAVSSIGPTTTFATVPEKFSGDDQPLEDESQPVAPTWDVQFSGLFTGPSRTGFARQGRLRIENGNLIFDGWKLWNKALRVIIGIVLAVGLISVSLGGFIYLDNKYQYRDADKSPIQSVEAVMAKVFLDKQDQGHPPEWLFFISAVLLHFVVYGIPICLALIVSSNYLAFPSKRAFVAASLPKGNGRKLTMKIKPADGSGKSCPVCLRFRNRTEALYFQSRFKQ